jgi:hypothetical protein
MTVFTDTHGYIARVLPFLVTLYCRFANVTIDAPFQVTIPVGAHDKCPISISLIARHGGDRFLLDTTQAIYATIQEQVEMLVKSNASSKEAMNEEAAEAAKEKVSSYLISHLGI